MANDLNKVYLIGRLTQDCGSDERSFGYVGNGQARANISIAVNHSKKEGDNYVDEADFFNVTIWGKLAENLKPYLTKGKQICVEGHLKQDRWEKDGQKQSRISIQADNVQLLGGKGENTAPNEKTVFTNAKDARQAFKQAEPSPSDEFPEDIPF